MAIVNVYDDENRGSAALNLVAIELVRRADPTARIGLVTIRDFDPGRRRLGYRHTLAAHPDVEVLPPLVDERSLVVGAASSIPAELIASRVARVGLDEETADFLRSADLVVSRGGVVYYNRPGVGDFAGLLRRTAAMRWTQRRGTPSAFLGLHVGEVRGAAGRRLVRQQFERAAQLLPRGPISDERIRRLAPGAAPQRLPDSVFALETGTTRTVGRSSEGKLLLVVSDPLEPHLDHVERMVARLLGAGLARTVSIAVQVTDVDSDRGAVAGMERRLGQKVEVIDDDLSPSGLIELYSGFDLLVSSRLHAAVFGLLAGVPSFPIEVSDDRKAADVFEEVGLSDFVLTLGSAERWDRQIARTLEGAIDRVSEAVDEARSRYSDVRVGC